MNHIHMMMRKNEDYKQVKRLAAKLRYYKKTNDDGPHVDEVAKEFVQCVKAVKSLYHDYFIIPSIFTYALEVLDELVEC